MSDFVASILTIAFLAQVLRITVPYALTALGGVLSERSGVINIALEGMLLTGAFTCAVAAHEVDSAVAGAVGGALGGLAVAAIDALAVVVFRADQIVAGVAINLFAYGITPYLLKLGYGTISNSPPIPGLRGDILTRPSFWLVVAVAAAVTFIVARTRPGLRLRAVGDHPEAASTLGVHVLRVRAMAVLASGILVGLGGAWMALANESFVAEMSGGRGYIALAAVIMGSWRPLWACAACLLFGFAEALHLNLEASAIGVPGELAQTFPYVLTMVTLAGLIGRSRPPESLGKPYEPD